MGNKIDQFFKDKLESHTLPPSEEAWSKVDARLTKKNNTAIWRIAAAILITGVLVSLLIGSRQSVDHNQPAPAANNSSKDNSIKEKPAPLISRKEMNVEAKSLPKKSSITPDLQLSSNQGQNNSVTAPEPLVTQKNILSNEESISAVEKNKIEEKIKLEATEPPTIASTRRKSIKLEFTLDDYSSEQPVATVSEEKSSGLKKVWELAREVKNGEGPVHEMKNELFAFNFKKNKNQ